MPPLAFTTYSILLRLFFIILVVCHNLRTSYLVLQTQTFFDFDVHTIAQSGGYLFAVVCLLLAAALYDIDKVLSPLNSMALSGTVITWLAFANTISALAL